MKNCNNVVGNSENTASRRSRWRGSSHLSDPGLLLLELTQSQDSSPRLVVELLLEGVEQLHLLAKAGHTHTLHITLYITLYNRIPQHVFLGHPGATVKFHCSTNTNVTKLSYTYIYNWYQCCGIGMYFASASRVLINLFLMIILFFSSCPAPRAAL